MKISKRAATIVIAGALTLAGASAAIAATGGDNRPSIQSPSDTPQQGEVGQANNQNDGQQGEVGQANDQNDGQQGEVGQANNQNDGQANNQNDGQQGDAGGANGTNG